MRFTEGRAKRKKWEKNGKKMEKNGKNGKKWKKIAIFSRSSRGAE
jgi:hypothetical protein